MKISIALCVVGIVLLGSLAGCKSRSDHRVKKVDWTSTRLADIVDTDAEDELDKECQDVEKDYWCAA